MFFEAMNLYRSLALKCNPTVSSHFQYNVKRTTNCPATRANVNELSKQRTDWRYHCSVTWATLLNNGEVTMRTSHFIIT